MFANNQYTQSIYLLSHFSRLLDDLYCL